MTPFGAYAALHFDFAGVQPGIWMLLVFYSLAASVWTVWLWMTGLKVVPAAQGGVFTVMLPVSAALVGVFVLGEPLRRPAAAGLRPRPGGRGAGDAAGQVRRCSADHDAVLVGIEPVARTHRNALDFHHEIALSFAALGRTQRHQRQCLDADAGAGELAGVAHGAVDHHAGPTVLRGSRREVAAHQRAANRTASIHDQHAPLPGRIHRFAHERVVLDATHGGNRAAEPARRAEVAENRRQDAESARGVLFMGIAEVAGGKGGVSFVGSWWVVLMCFRAGSRCCFRSASGP